MTFNSNWQPVSGAVNTRKSRGFTLIELMIVVAIIAIILTLGLPVYSNYSIRAKIGEGLSVAAAAKTATASTCLEDTTLTGLTNDAVGYAYDPSTWVESVTVSGDCTDPIITIVTKDTGAATDPELTLTGDIDADPAVIMWVCASDAENHLLPPVCRD